jgi:hypothetical protein
MELPMRHRNLIRLSLAAFAVIANSAAAVGQEESLGSTQEEFEAKLGYESGAVTIKDWAGAPQRSALLPLPRRRRLQAPPGKGLGQSRGIGRGRCWECWYPADISPLADSAGRW